MKSHHLKAHHQKILRQIQSTYEIIGEEFAQTRAEQTKDLQVLLPYIAQKFALLSDTGLNMQQPSEGAPKFPTLLDLGCGNGRLAGFLAKNISPQTFSYIGIDSSKTLLQIAQQQHSDSKFMLGDFLTIPLAHESVDIVCSVRAFHHLPSPDLQLKALQEIYRVLKPDGLLLITVWNLWQPQFRKHHLKSFGRSLVSLGRWQRQGLLVPWGKKAVRFYYAFKPLQLKKLMEYSLYSVLELAGIDRDQKVEVDKGSDILIVAKK